MYLSPNENYRYVMKEGMVGWDIQVLQVAFNNAPLRPNLAEDGAFGPLTTKAAKTIQRNLGITVDGIVGPQTQSTLCARECNSIKGLVPAGLLKGICFGESGGIIPATSGKYSNGSRDYGPLQDNMTNPSQTQLKEAYNPPLQAKRVAVDINKSYNEYLGQPGAASAEAAWRLAVLSYNWPAASRQIAAGNGNIWVYESEKKHYTLSDNAPWIENIGVAGVKNGWQWSNHYVNSKVSYVTSWSIV